MQRVLTAAVLAPTVLFIIFRGPYLSFFLLVACVAALCYYEFGGIARLHPAEIALGMAAGTLLLVQRPDLALITLTIFALLVLVIAMRHRPLAEILPCSSAQLFGLLYVYAAWNTAFLLRALSPYWLTFGLVVNWIGDTGAYYVGRYFGKNRLAPQISPGKTWEGAAASVLSAVVFGAVFLPRTIPSVKVWQAVLFSLLANVAGQVGDLAESAMKRGAGVKDSGTLLPGHGGMLDRVDSSLFSLPVLYGIIYFTSV